MSSQLLPPAAIAPDDLGELSPRDRVAVWLGMLDAGDKLILAGLAREIGAHGDIHAAYRAWYDEQMNEHDRVVERMLRRMQQRRSPHAS